jgi:adenylate kinase
MQGAIVLIGPTGSGKSPLGDLLASSGLWEHRCIHFDFGSELRSIASGQTTGNFNADEIQFVRNVLETGALLEDNDFHIALRAINATLIAQNADENSILALNGVPRHVGQARDLQAVVDVRAVVMLNCSPELVGARIATNAGGDRTERSDDDIAAVTKRLKIFAARTEPLADYYRQAGANIYTIEVNQTTQPREIVDELDHLRPKQL